MQFLNNKKQTKQKTNPTVISDPKFDFNIFQNLPGRWEDNLCSSQSKCNLKYTVNSLDGKTTVEERDHKLAPDRSFSPQGLNINHNISWKSGDKVIDGFSRYFGFSKERERVLSDSFKSCESAGMDVLSFVSKTETIIVLYISAVLLYYKKRNAVTRNLLLVFSGLIMMSRLASTDLGKVGILEIQTLWDYAWSTSKKEEEDVEMEEIFEPQGLEFDTMLISSVLSVILSAVAGYTVKKSFVNGLMNATKVNETQTNNITSLLLLVSKGVHEFLNNIKCSEWAKYFEINAVCDDRVAKYQVRVVQFVAGFNSGNPESMLYCMDVYKVLYEEGRQLDALIDKKSFDHKVIFDCVNKLITCYQKIEELKLSLSGERVEPVGVLLKGAPASMKGVLNKRLAAVLALATMPQEWRPAYKQDNREFFFSVPKDKFWDSYSNKAWITFYDDVFQRRDSTADSEADALKIIDMINSAPYTLQMANINQKNNVFFRSAFVMATTNLPSFDLLQSVQDVQAVRRRFHIEVDVSIRSKYLTKGKLDTAKLPFSVDIDNAKTIPNDFWRLEYVEKIGDKTTEKKYVTIKDLIKIIIERHSSHKKNFYSNRSAENRLVEDLAEELGYNWADSDIEPLEELEKEIFEPQGFFPDPPGFEKDCENFFNFLSSLEHEQLYPYDKLYWNMCDSLGRTDLYFDGFGNAMKHFFQNTCDVTEFVKHKEEPAFLMEMLKPVFKDSLKVGIHPLTRLPEWKSDESKRMRSPITPISEMFCEMLIFMESNPIYSLVFGIVGGTALFYLAKFFLSIFQNESHDVEPQSVDVQRMGKRVHGPRKTIKLSMKKPGITRVEAQGGVPINFEFDGLPKFSSGDFGEKNNKNDVLAKIFNKYFYIIYLVDHNKVTDDYETMRFGHAVNVTGQLFLMPFHFIFLMDAYRKRKTYKGATILLVTSTGSSRYSLSLEEFMLSFRTTEESSDKDLCLVKVEPAQRMSKGCIKYFLTQKDIENLMRTTSFSAHLAGTYHPNNDTHTLSIRNHYFRASVNKGGIYLNAAWEKENSCYSLYNTYMYEASTSTGDCGSLLVASESNYENRLICGLHVAGGSGKGFSTGFTKESVEDLIEKTFGKIDSFDSEEIPSFLLEIDPYDAQGSMKPIFKLKASHIPGEVFKSEIKKSRLYRRLPEPYSRVDTMPAKLKPFYTKDGELIDPLQKAFDKYGKIAPDIPYERLCRAMDSYAALFYDADKTTRESRKVIPLEDALHSFDYVNSISSSTSAGFPMSLKGEEDLKKLYYKAVEDGDQEEKERVLQRIATLVDDTLLKYKNGQRPFFAYKQCGKDETREWFKVLEGKTRLFSACPFLLLVLFRMYFGSFISSYVECNFKVGSAVGVNPYSADWDAIARNLLQFSESEDEEIAAAGDQGQFDTRQWIIIHNKILDFINDWYGNADPFANYIRTCLWTEIVSSRHVFRGEVYEWNSGLASGNPMTAIINTIYNHIIFRMAWEESGLEISDFNQCVYLIILGDDNVFTVKKVFRPVFNEMTMPILMAETGNEYTTELKGEAVFPFRKLEDVEFLKRSFRKDKTINRWVAPLRESAIAGMLNWTKKGKEGDQITLDNMCFALREFSLHGKPKFDFWRDALVDLKQELFPGMTTHGDMPLSFETTYKSVLNLEYYF